MGAEGMTQWLRAAHTSLARDLSLVASTHMGGGGDSQLAVMSALGDMTPFSGLQGHLPHVRIVFT